MLVARDSRKQKSYRLNRPLGWLDIQTNLIKIGLCHGCFCIVHSNAISVFIRYGTGQIPSE